MINWITTNSTTIGTVIAIATFLATFASLALTAFRYVEIRKREQTQLAFENYHNLIAELAGGVKDKQVMKLDSQIAVVYELRHFKKYKSVTIRILSGLHEEWAKSSPNPRLLKEIELTIEALS